MQLSENPNAQVYTPERKAIDPWIPDAQTLNDLQTAADAFETVHLALLRTLRFGTESRYAYSVYAALMVVHSPDRMAAFAHHPKIRPAYLAYTEYMKIRNEQYLKALLDLSESEFETYVKQIPKALQEKLRESWQEYHEKVGMME